MNHIIHAFTPTLTEIPQDRYTLALALIIWLTASLFLLYKALTMK